MTRRDKSRLEGARRCGAGFTLIELMIVVVIIGVLSFMAYPALKTFSARNAGFDSATFTTRTLNEAKARARMRNRAYIIRLRDFDNTQPAGIMEIREGGSPSCGRVAENINANSRLITQYSYGSTQLPPLITNDTTKAVAEVGLMNWVRPGSNQARNVPLVLCVKTDGSVVDASTLAPISGGHLSIRVQRFELVQNGNAWRRTGPSRVVAVPFAGPARMELN